MEPRRLVSDDWKILRDVRLAALADAPYAYGSTLEGERSLPEANWRSRFDTACWVVAVRNAENAGVVGALLLPDDVPMLISMWVNPAHRGRGVGDALITELLRLGKEKRWSGMVLRVAEGNDAARKLFLRHGFAPTGEYAPLESDPEVRTEFLSRAL